MMLFSLNHQPQQYKHSNFPQEALCDEHTPSQNKQHQQGGACPSHPDPDTGTGMSTMMRRTDERHRLTLLLSWDASGDVWM